LELFSGDSTEPIPHYNNHKHKHNDNNSSYTPSPTPNNDPYDFPVCWFKTHSSIHIFDVVLWQWVLFYVPLIVIYVFALRTVYQVHHRSTSQ